MTGQKVAKKILGVTQSILQINNIRYWYIIDDRRSIEHKEGDQEETESSEQKLKERSSF